MKAEESFQMPFKLKNKAKEYPKADGISTAV